VQADTTLMKVFFDADALIAGSASNQGVSFILLQLAELELIAGLTSEQVIEECRRNLENKLPDAISTFEQIISHALKILDNPSIEKINKFEGCADKKDIPIFVAAVLSDADFLVTFNTKDFWPTPDVSLLVLEPGKLLQKIREQLNRLTND